MLNFLNEMMDEIANKETASAERIFEIHSSHSNPGKRSRFNIQIAGSRQ
jgi:hypothetical protein